MIKLNCLHCDTCLPDYFGGHHLAWVCVPIDNKMSFKQLREYLHYELNQGAIGGNEPLSQDDYGEDGYKWFEDAEAVINRDVKPSNKGCKRPFKDIEFNDECEEVPHAFFVFKEA